MQVDRGSDHIRGKTIPLGLIIAPFVIASSTLRSLEGLEGYDSRSRLTLHHR
jgi:hypothetical protein